MNQDAPFLIPERAHQFATVLVFAVVSAFWLWATWYEHYRQAKTRTIRGWLLRSNAFGFGMAIFVLGAIMLISGAESIVGPLALNATCIHLLFTSLGGTWVAVRETSKREAFSDFLD